MDQMQLFLSEEIKHRSPLVEKGPSGHREEQKGSPLIAYFFDQHLFKQEKFILVDGTLSP
jgi:hypothetical protein